MTAVKDQKNQIIQTVFLLIPILVLAKLGDVYANDSIYRILFAGLFGIVGGIIGFLFYHFVRHKSLSIKIGVLTFLTLASFSILIVSLQNKKDSLGTCEICGYKTLKSDDDSCPYCGAEPWELEKKNGDFSTKQEWIQFEQLFLFELDSVNQEFDFYSPKVEQGFVKDENWKPSVNKEDQLRQFNSYE